MASSPRSPRIGDDTTLASFESLCQSIRNNLQHFPTTTLGNTVRRALDGISQHYNQSQDEKRNLERQLRGSRNASHTTIQNHQNTIHRLNDQLTQSLRNAEIAIRDCEGWQNVNANMRESWRICEENYKCEKLLHAFWHVNYTKNKNRLLSEIFALKILCNKYKKTSQPRVKLYGKYNKWKRRARAKHVKYNKWKLRNILVCDANRELEEENNYFRQQILDLQNNIPQNQNMAGIQDVTSALAPLLAQIPMYIGQEPPQEYFNKVMQIFQFGNTLGVAGFNDAVKTRMLTSRLAERFTPPDPFQNRAGNRINTPALFIDWLEDKYREVMIGTNQASMKALINEKFSPLDTPDSYKQRIRTFTHSIADDDCLPILYNHLPENLELRVRMTAPATKDAFFTNLRNCWLESNGSRRDIQPSNAQSALSLKDIASQTHVAISTPPPQIPYYQQPQLQPKLQPQENKNRSFDHLESIAMRLGYSDDASRNPDNLEDFIEDELYKRLGHANYHLRKEPFGQVNEVSTRTSAELARPKKVYVTKKPTKVIYKCSSCGKIGHRKNKCPKLGKKSKKVNYTIVNQSELKDYDQEDEPIVVIEDEDEENDEESEDEETISDSEPQNCFNVKKKVGFL